MAWAASSAAGIVARAERSRSFFVVHCSLRRSPHPNWKSCQSIYRLSAIWLLVGRVGLQQGTKAMGEAGLPKSLDWSGCLLTALHRRTEPNQWRWRLRKRRQLQEPPRRCSFLCLLEASSLPPAPLARVHPIYFCQANGAAARLVVVLIRAGALAQWRSWPTLRHLSDRRFGPGATFLRGHGRRLVAA